MRRKEATTRKGRGGDDAESKIAHETTDALTLSGHARTPSGCKSGDIKRIIIKKGSPLVAQLMEAAKEPLERGTGVAARLAVDPRQVAAGGVRISAFRERAYKRKS